MDQKISGLILAIFLAIFVLLSGYLISLTGLSIDYFLTINLLPLADGFLSIYFIAFLITVSISLTIINHITKNMPTQEALIVSLGGYLIGAIASAFLFIEIEFIFVLLFTGLGISLSVKMYSQTENNFTQKFKSASAVSGKIVLFFGIGIFILIILITLPDAKTYESNFAGDLVESFIGGEGNNLSAPIISSIGKIQKDTLASVQQTPEYTLMQSKNDSDFFKLEMKLEELKVYYTSEEYLKTVSKETGDFISKDGSTDQLDLELPLVKDLAKYAWLIYALIALASVLFIGELILKNLSALFFAISSKKEI